MQPQHQLLVNHLAASSWHQLVALLAAHQLPRAAREQKAALVKQLAHHLTQPATIAAIVAQLTAAGKDALRQLLTADGALPSHTFETRYGPIRPFKPWRKDQEPADRQPWLAPISTTEMLWYRGLIFRAPPHRQPGVVPHYVLPADLADLVAAALGLAPHSPNPAPRAQGVLLGQPGRNGGLDHHLAIWLATVQAGLAGQGVTPVHQRWLPPAVVALLCTRLGLDQDLGFTPIRSERHHPYLAFLHYLALAAELVAVTPAACQVTPTGWAWLTAPPATRQAQLTAAWRTAPLELARPFAFRWEPLSPAARPLVVEQLATQVAAHPTVATLIAQWRLLDPYGYLPGPRLAHWHDEDSLYDPLTALITGPLHWLGFITLTGTALTLDPATLLVGPPSSSIQPPAAACTMPKQPVNTILAPVTVQPLHLVQLAPFCDWSVTTTPTAIPHTFTLSPPRIAQLAAGGTRPEQLIAALAAAVGRPPSRRVISRIRSWAQPGQQLRLRPLLVLEADTPERLAQLRRYKLVRNRLGAVIAPNRISLNPADAEALAQTLRTLGYYVEPPATVPSSPERVPAGREGDEGAAAGLAPMWQWLLITLYQGLGAQLPLPLAFPWATRQAVRAQLTAAQQATAEAAAQQLLDRLQMALNGYLQVPLWHAEATPDAAPVIRTALDQNKEIEIRYAGPSDGHVTTRTVTPYWIEERHGIAYLIGWCHLRQQERTFRIDRIEAVVVS